MAEQRGDIVSIQVGKIQWHTMPAGVRVDYRHDNWQSAIFKEPVAGRVWVADVVAGDEQADLTVHGGPDNVVLAYNAAHYPGWRREFDMPGMPFGAFGENFTVNGFTDEDVCIGDVWEVGDAGLRLEVTQARQPCYKLARRLGQPHIVKRVRDTGHGGWYLRVLTPGEAAAGMEIRRTERRHPEWPVAKAVQVIYGRNKDPNGARDLAALPELSTRWREDLLQALG